MGGDRVIAAISIYPPEGPILVYPANANRLVPDTKHADLLADSGPRIHSDIERAIKSGKPTLSDPYRLRSGSIGMAARRAISRNGAFWGMAEVILDLEPLVEDSGYGPGTSDLSVALADSSGNMFRGEPAVRDSDPIRYTVPLPERSWTLYGTPKGGWNSRLMPRVALVWLSGILLSLLLAIMARSLALKFSAITKRVSDQETRLAESRRWIELAVSASGIGFFEYDVGTRATLRSPEYEQQLGYGVGEMPPGSSYWAANIHPDDREVTLRIEADCVEGRKNEFETEYRLRHRDDSWRWILARGKVVRDDKGEPLRILGCHIDISWIKTAEESLQRSEDRYRTIIKNLPLGIVHIMDRDFRYVFDSGEQMDRLGLSEATLVGKSIYDILDPATAEFVAGQYRRVLAGESVRYEGSFRGESFLVQAAPLRASNGLVEQILALSINITERKVAEERLVAAHEEQRRLLKEADRSRMALLSLVEDKNEAEAEIKKLNAGLEEHVRDRTAKLRIANKELEAFSYSVSHDLRTPLRAMNGFATALLDEYGRNLDEKATHYLERIQESSIKMGQLINDLLGLAQISRSEFSRVNVDLSAIATRVACGLKDAEPGRNVAFVIAPGLKVLGDARLLEILMENLLGNAWKYSGKRAESRIQVGSEELGGQTVFFVKDNGVGFDMTYVDKLFMPFQRLHRVDEFPGTGIGLVTVHRIVARHGGRIWPEAEIDSGATFYFTLDGAGGT